MINDAPPAPPCVVPVQVLVCLVTLACAAYWAHVWAPFRQGSFQAYAILQSVNFAIFISASGMLGSTFLLLAPRLAPKLAECVSVCPSVCPLSLAPTPDMQ